MLFMNLLGVFWTIFLSLQAAASITDDDSGSAYGGDAAGTVQSRPLLEPSSPVRPVRVNHAAGTTVRNPAADALLT